MYRSKGRPAQASKVRVLQQASMRACLRGTKPRWQTMLHEATQRPIAQLQATRGAVWFREPEWKPQRPLWLGFHTTRRRPVTPVMVPLRQRPNTRTSKGPIINVNASDNMRNTATLTLNMQPTQPRPKDHDNWTHGVALRHGRTRKSQRMRRAFDVCVCELRQGHLILNRYVETPRGSFAIVRHLSVCQLMQYPISI